jgi:hypothetical protein
MALVDSLPDMAAVIAYRRRDGSVGVALSRRIAGSYRATPRD